MKRLRQLEEENAKLKKLVADLSLDKLMLQDVRTVKILRPAEKRQAVRYLQERFQASERRNRKSITNRPADSSRGRSRCMDFVLNQLYNWKRFRALTVLDTFSRESLAIYVDKSIKGEQVCDELEKIKAARGLPQRIKVDNSPEFISRALDAWAHFNKVKLDYSRPGTPTDNPHIESFNGSF